MNSSNLNRECLKKLISNKLKRICVKIFYKIEIEKINDETHSISYNKWIKVNGVKYSSLYFNKEKIKKYINC